MEVFLINGLDKKDDALFDLISNHLTERGCTLNTLTPRESNISPCQGCFGCWLRTPGVCVIDDAGRDVAKMFAQNDVMVFLSPVIFGGYSSDLKMAVDRIIPISQPFFMITKTKKGTHHPPRYENRPCLVGIGVVSGHDEESEQIFGSLVERNALNYHSPAHTAGVVLRNDPPETIKAEIDALFAKVKR